MLNKEVIKVLEELKNHACYDREGEGAEYGIYECCGNCDYAGHKPNCTRVQAINQVIEILK